MPRALQANQLVCQPGDRIALAASRRMLYQITPANPILYAIGQELADDIELVIAGKDLSPLFLPCPFIGFFDDLRVVLENVRQILRTQYLAPEVIGLDSMRIRWIACTVVPPLVEGKKP